MSPQTYPAEIQPLSQAEQDQPMEMAQSGLTALWDDPVLRPGHGDDGLSPSGGTWEALKQILPRPLFTMGTQQGSLGGHSGPGDGHVWSAATATFLALCASFTSCEFLFLVLIFLGSSWLSLPVPQPSETEQSPKKHMSSSEPILDLKTDTTEVLPGEKCAV